MAGLLVCCWSMRYRFTSIRLSLSLSFPWASKPARGLYFPFFFVQIPRHRTRKILAARGKRAAPLNKDRAAAEILRVRRRRAALYQPLPLIESGKRQTGRRRWRIQIYGGKHFDHPGRELYDEPPAYAGCVLLWITRFWILLSAAYRRPFTPSPPAIGVLFSIDRATSSSLFRGNWVSVFLPVSLLSPLPNTALNYSSSCSLFLPERHSRNFYYQIFC